MTIVKVTVKREAIEVKYERKTGWCRKSYTKAPQDVFDFMMKHKAITKRNGDYVYINENHWSFKKAN